MENNVDKDLQNHNEGDGQVPNTKKKKEINFISWGLSLGIIAGVVFGALLDNLTLGLILGPGLCVMVGIILQSHYDKKNGIE